MNLLQLIKTDAGIVVHDIETGVQTGFKFLVNEAEAAYQWLQQEVQSPAVQDLLAKALQSGEQAAASLVQNYEPALQAGIAKAVDGSQTFVANLLEELLGGNVKQALTTIPAAQAGVAQLGSAAGLIAQQAFALVIAKLLASAA